MGMVAQLIETNTWKIPSPFPLFSPQFIGRTMQVQRNFEWLNPLQTHIQLPFPPQEPAPCSAFSCRKMQGCPAPQLLHSGACKLERGGTVPSKWGDVLSSSCWTSLSGADTCRHKTLNLGSPEVLKILYKSICILLKQIAPGHPLQLYIKGMYTQRREGERELGRDFSWDCYLGDDAWQAYCFQGYSWEFIFFAATVNGFWFLSLTCQIFSPASGMVFVMHLFVSSLARSVFRKALFVPISLSGVTYFFMGHICKQLSISAGLSPCFTVLSTWDFEVPHMLPSRFCFLLSQFHPRACIQIFNDSFLLC